MIRKRIRAGRGLGDAIYLNIIVRHLLAKGETDLEVCTDWPDVFSPFGDRITIAPFQKGNIRIVAHYAPRKHVKETDQFEDMCLYAGIKELVDEKIEWTLKNQALANMILNKAAKESKRILFVQLPRPPMDRKDGFGIELLPKWTVMDAIIDAVKDKCFIVQCGAGVSLHTFSHIDLDISNKTSVNDLMDIGIISDYFLGPCGYIVPMGEGFLRQHIITWGANVRTSPTIFIRQMSPEKVQHRLNKNGCVSHFIWDDWPIEKIIEKARQVFF